MCGRYTLTTPLDDLLEVFAVPPPTFEYRPRYNIAPSQEAPVVLRGREGRRLELLRWGLVPAWAEDPSVGNRLINARVETVARKPAFRDAYRLRRCLVPADGFYEWKRVPGRTRKVPFWIHDPERVPFAMAGLWEGWRGEGMEPLGTFAILTTEASEELREIHGRMPVVLPPDAWEAWLDPGTEPGRLAELLGRGTRRRLEAWEVSTLVNAPTNDVPACVEPVAERPRNDSLPPEYPSEGG